MEEDALTTDKGTVYMYISRKNYNEHGGEGDKGRGDTIYMYVHLLD